MKTSIVLDAGHGGAEPGALFQGRREKDDNLRLTLAIGELLQKEGITVWYTRVDDSYQSPFEKAMMANRSGADYFVSIHRNAMPVSGSGSGITSLVYQDEGIAATMARNINQELSSIGFSDLGVTERSGLIVLRRTEMPAVLVEAGFIDNEADNALFDSHFSEIAQAIANGILDTIWAEASKTPASPIYYQVQTGAYENRQEAEEQLQALQNQGFPAFLVYEDGLFKVRAGAFLNLDNAVRQEQQLKKLSYPTYMVYRPVTF
ncbi:MAG: N-acetylmuramoyl-L-alanine amidase [bacterium]|nr:N-acetylmuramoyl-L-alanine amidase [bacterium]